ncbi:MAG: winged helix DNA-binding domain-containing protein [Sphaerochaeta sp.]|nr:winged helix DNA-binding domain-containing protein [Sphaerochaeta sp.]
MLNVTVEQIRNFRLRSHHLDRWYDRLDAAVVVGGCGIQNSPPGSWQLALANRIKDCSPQWMRRQLEEERTLLQAWSIRGVPLVFPTTESDVFLTALIAAEGERWIYTNGADLALAELGMDLEEVLALVTAVIPRLDEVVIESKNNLDAQVAGWVEPLLNEGQRVIWNHPSMYDARGEQRLGQALISFLLRPCSCKALVVFGKRNRDSPTFTSYRTWVGHDIESRFDCGALLVKKFLHCYGPATRRHFNMWLGSSPAQAARLWQEGESEMEMVKVGSQTRFMLSEDVLSLTCSEDLVRKTHLLSAHDPYLGLQDRQTICSEVRRQRVIWRTVANPGAILSDGEVVGFWKSKKREDFVDVELSLWDGHHLEHDTAEALALHHAGVRGCRLGELSITQ